MKTEQKLFYYCDCPKNEKERKQYAKNNRVKMSLTTCNSEGICDNCGYYAYASTTEETSNGLYRKLHNIDNIGYKERAKKESAATAENGYAAGRWQDFYIEHRLGE